MILVVGASGRLGSHVAQLILARGMPVRAMSRDVAKLASLTKLGAEPMTADLRNPASLSRACENVDQVVAAAHAFAAEGDNHPGSVDDAGNRHLIDACRTADVKHFVFTSVHDARDNHPLEFFRIKFRVEEYLRARLVEVAAIFERVTGRTAKKSHLPLPLMRMMTLLMRRLNPTLSRQIAAGVYMATEDQTLDMTETLKRFPLSLHRLEDVVRAQYLQ